MRNVLLAVLAVTVAGLFSPPAAAEDKSIIVQSTTSTANSGLYDYLLPKFKQASGITVRVVAVGTGQAIKNAKNCDGDVLLVHAKSSEEKFVELGIEIPFPHRTLYIGQDKRGQSPPFNVSVAS